MIGEHTLALSTSDGVYGLSRILNTFALLGITPTELWGGLEQDRMRLIVRFPADPERASLCQARLSVMACIEVLPKGATPPCLAA
jgi:hypothetical protein